MTEWLSLTEVALRDAPADRPVALRHGRTLTHAQFRSDVRRWHAALCRHAGARLALYFDDPYDFAAALFGAWHAGKQVVLPGDAQPATLARLLPQVDACAGLLPHAIEPAADPADAPDLQPLDLQRTTVVIYTSGSSGQPLAIHKRLAQLESEIVHLQAAFGQDLDTPGLTVFSTVSHQHIYGLLFLTLWPLAAGRAIEVERLAYPEQMAEILGSRPSVLISSPAHLRRLSEATHWQAARSRLRAVFSSGGPLPAEAAQQSLDLLGHSPTEVYGSSETGGVAWRRRARHGERWEALPGVQWRLEPASQTLCVRSSHLGDEDWWETSDRAQALDDGGFVLLGRVDRIVKIEEKRVSLSALEQTVLATGLLIEARALLVPSDAGQRLALVAVPSETGWPLLQRDGKRAFNERLRGELLQAVERVALPRRFRYVRALPANSQGKTTEAQLLALFDPALPPARWLTCETHQGVLSLDITPHLRVFDGHFPGTPVLPGIAQLDWAIRFARTRFELPPAMLRAEQLKFQKEVIPPLQLELTLEWHAEQAQLRFRYASPQGTHSTGRLVFGAADV